MRTLFRTTVLTLVLALAAMAVYAQDKPAAPPAKPAAQAPVVKGNPTPEPSVPTLTESDKLKLENIEIKLTNLAMQSSLIAQQQEKLQAEGKALFQSLAKPGFQLNKDQQTGVWGYTPEKPADKPAEPAAKPIK